MLGGRGQYSEVSIQRSVDSPEGVKEHLVYVSIATNGSGEMSPEGATDYRRGR